MPQAYRPTLAGHFENCSELGYQCYPLVAEYLNTCSEKQQILEALKWYLVLALLYNEQNTILIFILPKFLKGSLWGTCLSV